ncbi:hypothetical protein WJX79_010744 [Trebouxia sp. C0005]
MNARITRLLNADQLSMQRFWHAGQNRTVSIGPPASPVHARADVNSLPQATAKEEQASASNGSHFSLGADHIAVVKDNGSSIVPQQGSGNNGGSGQGGGGSGGGHHRNDSPGDGPDYQTKFLLLLLSIALGAASVYGIYHLLKAIHRVTSRRQAAQPTLGTQQRPHDDIAALKRLLQEVFTNQMQMERRISVIEPHEDDQPSFDPLERSRNGWASLSAPGKSKVELSGNVVMGSALLYSTEQDEQRAASSLDQTGVSTSTSMTLDIKTDLGGPESGGLHAQCILDADKSQAHLQKVLYECQPREDMSLYLAPLGGEAADAVMTLNAQAGQGVSYQVQQGCPLHQRCKGSGAVLNYTHQDKTVSAAHFRQGRSRSSSDEVEESSAVHYLAQQGASSYGQQHDNELLGGYRAMELVRGDSNIWLGGSGAGGLEGTFMGGHSLLLP